MLEESFFRRVFEELVGRWEVASRIRGVLEVEVCISRTLKLVGRHIAIQEFRGFEATGVRGKQGISLFEGLTLSVIDVLVLGAQNELVPTYLSCS